MSRSAEIPHDPELAALAARERELLQRIAETAAEPERLRREAEERAATLPPPDDLADRRRRIDFENKASRGQIRNERRAQGRSLMLTIFLLAAIVSLVAWVFKLAQG